MQVTETFSQGLKRELQVVVSAAELKARMMSRLGEMAGRAHIRGFRPGKVPVPHLERLYGKSVMAEVVQQQVDEGAKKILGERNLKPAYQPEVKLPEDKDEVARIFEGKSDFSYSMAFEVVPEFELQDVSGLTFERHVVEATPEQVDEAIKRIADQSKTFEPKSGPAETGDRVTISFKGTIGGEPFEGGEAEDVPLELGSGQFLPGFEAQLSGTFAGEERRVNVTFPDAYGVDKLAGKPAAFDVKIATIEAPKKPAIDDDFAKTLGADSLEALKAMTRERLAAEFGQMTGAKLKRDVLDALDKAYTFDLPERLVEAEFASIWKALGEEMRRAGKSFADEGTSEEEAREEYRAIAERRVRLGLVLGTMGEREGVKITDEELQRALIARASQFRGQERQVLEFYRKNPRALIELRGPIFEQKVVDLIVSKAQVSDTLVSREELAALVHDDDEHEPHHAHDHDHRHDHAEGHEHAHDGDHRHAAESSTPALEPEQPVEPA